MSGRIAFCSNCGEAFRQRYEASTYCTACRASGDIVNGKNLKFKTAVPHNHNAGEVAEMAMRLSAEIPDDTRDVTARIMGDPLPGRSALDRASEANTRTETERRGNRRAYFNVMRYG